jgi:hypothetical protein
VSWRRVAAIYAVLTGLAAWVALSGRDAPAPDPAAGPPPAEQSLLGTDAAAVTALAVQRAGVRVRAVRDGARWRVVEPAGAEVSSDLVAALAATLTAGQASEMMAALEESDLEAFGLAAPSTAIVVTLAGARVRVLLGGANPTGTALYAMRDDRPSVYLVGLNVRYYSDLILAAAAGAG